MRLSECPFVIGIVGSEQAKFTPETEEKARRAIRDTLDFYDPTLVVSGACHLGGVDRYAVEEAGRAGIRTVEYKPDSLTWEFYKKRNLQIAEASDLVVCITVKVLPEHYASMRFPLCYHCKTDTHVKSGGCWTMKEAAKLGKETQLIVID